MTQTPQNSADVDDFTDNQKWKLNPCFGGAYVVKG